MEKVGGSQFRLIDPSLFEKSLLKYFAFPLENSPGGTYLSARNKVLLFNVLVIVIIASIPLLRYALASDVSDIFFVDTAKHSSLESFCGLISLMVGLILFWEYSASGRRNVLFLIMAFFSIGILDLFHAFSDHDHNTFVWFHSFSAFFGSVFLVASIFAAGAKKGEDTSVWRRRTSVLIGTVVILVFAVLSLQLDSVLPSVLKMTLPYRTNVASAKGNFSNFIYMLNFISSMLFLFAGITFVRGFLKTSDVIYLIFGTFSLLFFESEFLFTQSKLWDPMWWYWHIIKVIVFTGLLIGLGYGFTKTVHILRASENKLAGLIEEIGKKNVEISSAYDRMKETQRYLNESEKLASMGKMAAMIAHEIRNPLGAISNSLGVLRRYDSLDLEDRELIEIVENEMDRLSMLTEEFLSFSRPTNLQRNETDIHELIEETILLLRLDEKASRGIRIQRSLVDDIPPLLLDRNAFKQILLNLCLNAVQAMPGGGDLMISTNYNASQKEVELTIADTGIGMTQEVLSQVFQPFFTTKDKGLGLGLNIVYKTVKEHGGYVLIESEQGKGTRIQLNIPVLQSGNADEAITGRTTQSIAEAKE